MLDQHSNDKSEENSRSK